MVQEQIFSIEELSSIFDVGVRGVINQSFKGVSTDTRKVEPGMLFVALVGEKFDGHNFLQQAVDKGATGVVVNSTCQVPAEVLRRATVFTVEDTLKGYQAIASLWRKKFSIPVIAITGSNGKTTTKDLTAAVLSGKYNVLKTQANFNNEIGLPLTLLNLNQSHTAAVVEMGMRGLGQIKELVDIAKPNIGVVTNVGETHMELLGSMENIAKAKGELPEGIPAEGKVILNGDDPLVAQMDKLTKGEVITFGTSADLTVYGTQVEFDPQGYTSFIAHLPIGELPVKIAVLGMHNVYNTLAAIAVGYACDLTLEEMAQGITNYQPTKMRFETEEFHGIYLINDAYNASPMSVKAALENVNLIAKGRKVLVMGDMFELGSVEKQAHENIGSLAGKLKFDSVFTRGDLTKHTIAGAVAAGVKLTQAFPDHTSLAEYLINYLQPGDTVLFKGSHGMHMEEVIDLIKKMWR